MKSPLFLFWQAPQSRRWHAVGKLDREGDKFRFVYTYGAKAASGFQPFGRMTDLEKKYESESMFPIFENRLLSKSRSGYKDFVSWLGLSESEVDPMNILALTGGARATDTLLLYPKPVPTEDNRFILHFFLHGIQYMPVAVLGQINKLQPGESLFPMFDVLNDHDPYAVTVRTSAPPHMIGYVPRFFARDIRFCMRGIDQSAHLKVVQVNPEAPTQMRLLCRFEADWPADFSPCDSEEFKPIME